MRNVDAPPAGWYPDPDGRTRLRWWDGLDWTDIRRAPPSNAELIAAEENHEFFQQASMPAGQISRPGGVTQQDASQIIAEVRNVARQEVDRAAQQFSNRTTAAMRSVTPLITQYTSRITRWIRLLSVVAIVVLIAWLAFQIFVEVTLFEWIGDRIDNITDNINEDSGAIVNPFSG
ncbi:DUF2510 domain-containing protein [Ilumatobacter sp.]|uniref:DUF2510 domain-containing protein n=1 Tax=Ilumatobacter sp. TaxID=1967498 RepID=UPI003AF9A24D